MQGRRNGRGARRGGEGDEPAPPLVGTVTAITASGRREGRFDVAVDGKRAVVVSLDLIDRLGLRVGSRLDEAMGAQLVEGAGELATFDRALGMLAAQGRSATELRRRLVMRGEAAARVDAAIARLQAAGLLDDASFARQVARSRVLGRGESRRRVAQVLGRKGVARELADEAVAEVFDDEAVDEPAMVEAAARKRMRSLGGLDVATQRRRLWAFLGRRGFDGDAIRRAVDRVIGEAEEGELETADLDGADPDAGAGGADAEE